jgi:hypothetical protein
MLIREEAAMHHRKSATTRRSHGKWIGAALALVAAVIPAAPADASLTPFGDEDTVNLILVGVGALALVIPGDIGVAVPASGASNGRFVLGWSVQIPVEPDMRHRIVPSLDLLVGDGTSWRGRLGYRYARRYLLAGAGVGLDGAGVDLSPEVGVRFLHAGRPSEDADISMHLLARAEIDPGSGRLRGGTFLLGWNLL